MKYSVDMIETLVDRISPLKAEDQAKHIAVISMALCIIAERLDVLTDYVGQILDDGIVTIGADQPRIRK